MGMRLDIHLELVKSVEGRGEGLKGGERDAHTDTPKGLRREAGGREGDKLFGHSL